MVVAWALAVVGVAVAASGRPVAGTSLLVGSGAALAGAEHAVPLALGVAAAVACGHWIQSGSDARLLGFLVPGLASLAATLGPATAAPLWLGWAAAIVVAPRPERSARWRELARPGSVLLVLVAIALVTGPGRLIPHAGG
jgi:hypothetical protein